MNLIYTPPNLPSFSFMSSVPSPSPHSQHGEEEAEQEPLTQAGLAEAVPAQQAEQEMQAPYQAAQKNTRRELERQLQQMQALASTTARDISQRRDQRFVDCIELIGMR